MMFSPDVSNDQSMDIGIAKGEESVHMLIQAFQGSFFEQLSPCSPLIIFGLPKKQIRFWFRYATSQITAFIENNPRIHESSHIPIYGNQCPTPT